MTRGVQSARRATGCQRQMPMPRCLPRARIAWPATTARRVGDKRRLVPCGPGVRALLAQFRLQGFDERNQHLGLYLGLFNDGNVRTSPPLVYRCRSRTCMFPVKPTIQTSAIVRDQGAPSPGPVMGHRRKACAQGRLECWQIKHRGRDLSKVAHPQGRGRIPRKRSRIFNRRPVKVTFRTVRPNKLNWIKRHSRFRLVPLPLNDDMRNAIDENQVGFVIAMPPAVVHEVVDLGNVIAHSDLRVRAQPRLK